MGIKIYHGSTGMVQDNPVLFKNGRLSKIAVEHACGGHAGGCERQ